MIPTLEIASNANATDLKIRAETAIAEIEENQPELNEYLKAVQAAYGDIAVLVGLVVYDAFKRAL